MIAEKLRQAVLQAAVSGQLTDQLEEDGTAAELLEKIATERNALVKAGKLRKQKRLPLIIEEDEPFEIPSNWVWVRLGELTYDRGQESPSMEFSYIDISTIDNEHQNICRDKIKIIRPANAPSRARKLVFSGDLIYSTVRPYLHNVAIVPTGISPKPIVSTGFSVLTTGDIETNKFLMAVTLSTYFDVIANKSENSKGIAYPAISESKLKLIPIPLPPKAEQDRIVAILDQVIPLIDRLAELEREREDLDKQFAELFGNTVMRALMSGVYTERWRSARGIPGPVETTLGKVYQWSSGGTPSRGIAQYYGGDIPWYKTGELRENVLIDSEEHITQAGLDSSSAKVFPKNTVLIAMYGATVGRVAVLGAPGATNQACAAALPCEGSDSTFLMYSLIAKRPEFLSASKGGAQPNISQTVIKATPFLEFDIREQIHLGRIAERVFSSLKSLRASLSSAT